MRFGRLECKPISVTDAMQSEELDRQQVAVHGILYHGEGCDENEFLLLPKNGTFDGVDPLPAIRSVDRNKCLLIDELELENRLGLSGASGSFRWKHDAIVIGEIFRQVATKHPVRIGRLWLILLQSWDDFDGVGEPYHSLRIVTFPAQLPRLPWDGFQGERHVSPVIEVYPEGLSQSTEKA